MAAKQTSKVSQHLRRVALLQDGAGLTDAQLLKEYLNGCDEAALAALVRRHGPMIWSVCRRILANYHDVEDAFQATFLVFVRKAASIASPELLANWLYGVAHQTALKARATSAKRKTRERQVKEMPEPAVTQQDFWDDLQPLLDRALSGLPDKYRVAIVLCDLEGKTRKEAARQLGVPEGTLAARLARGRKMLGQRLARYGLVLSGGTLAVVLAQNAASASVPSVVVTTTIKAASLFAVEEATVGLVSAKAVALAEGVLKTMVLAKLKIATTIVLGMGLLGISWGLYPTHAAAPPEGKQEAAPPPPSAFAAPDKEGGTPAPDGHGEKKIGLPKGPPPVQILARLTTEGKLMVKSEHILIYKAAMRAAAQAERPDPGPRVLIKGVGGLFGQGHPPRTLELSYDLKDVQVLDTTGKEVGNKELAKLLKDETLAVASFGDFDPLQLRVLKEGTLVFVLPPPPAGGLPEPAGMPLPPGGIQALLPRLGPITVPILFIRTERPALEAKEQ
jgi:RNA polymerase sigma factor (sigma-70 family)